MTNVLATLASMSPLKRDYALKYTPSHLAKAGQVKQLYRCLTNFDFIEAKVSALGIQPLIEDYNLALNPDLLLSEEQAHTLGLIQGAVRLSVHILEEDKTQLAGQLWGRLLSFEVPEIQAMLEVAKQSKAVPWLRPLTPSLTPPGGRLLRTLKGKNPVSVTPDGKQLISGSGDNTLKVWNLETGEELFTFTGHTKPIRAVAVTPDGKQVISGSGDNTLKVWDIKTGKAVFTLTGHISAVNAVAVTLDSKRVISGSHDTTLKVWDLNTGRELCTLGDWRDSKTRLLEKLPGKGDFDFIDPVYSIAVTPDGKQVIAGYDYKTIRVWDLEKKTQIFSRKCDAVIVRSVAVTPDGKRLISASGHHNIQVWNLETMEEILRLKGHTSCITSIAVTSDGKQLISYAYDRFKVWNLETGEEIFTFQGATEEVKSVSLTPDSKRLISGSSTVKIWNLETVAETPTLTGHSDTIWELAITPDGKKVISSSSDKTLKVWNLDNQKEIFSLKGNIDPGTSIAVTPDGQTTDRKGRVLGC